MRRDPTNMPFARPGGYRTLADVVAVSSMERSEEGGALPSGGSTTSGADTVLKAESILLEEFNAASVAAYQAREESASLINIYLLAAGALATGLGILASNYTPTSKLTVTLVQVAVLGIATLFSFAVFVRHLDLGGEYRDGLLAMNVIKEFYIGRLGLQLPQINAAFYRRLADVPWRHALGAGAAVMSCAIALLGGLAAAGTVGLSRQLWAIATDTAAPYLTELQVSGITLPYFWEVLAGAIALILQFIYYRLSTRESRAAAAQASLR